MAKRDKTQYRGVTVHTAKDGEKFYYIRYLREKKGKQIEECVGTRTQGMTPAKAAIVRAARQTGQAMSNEQRRAKEKETENAWTVKKLYSSYQATLPEGRGRESDDSCYKWIDALSDMEPHAIETKQIEEVKRQMEKAGKAPQTIKHAAVLLSRIINFGVKSGLIPQTDTQKLRIVYPKVDNKKQIETMTDAQLEKYLNALNEEKNQDAANILRIALVTGMRRNAILSLEWEDIDFENSNIRLRGEVAKKRKTDFIKLNNTARSILSDMFTRKTGKYVFQKKSRSFVRMTIRARDRAGLPADFRPVHGLRHTFASRLISSGKVSLAELQKLLTHEDIKQTLVYSHFSDLALQNAANAADDVMMFSRTEHGRGGPAY